MNYYEPIPFQKVLELMMTRELFSGTPVADHGSHPLPFLRSPRILVAQPLPTSVIFLLGSWDAATADFRLRNMGGFLSHSYILRSSWGAATANFCFLHGRWGATTANFRFRNIKVLSSDVVGSAVRSVYVLLRL